MWGRNTARCELAAACVLVLVASFSLPARAATPPAVDDAASAYDRGAAAFDRGDFAVAASALARADELAPNTVTLELALRAATKAEDAPLAMTLAERTDTRDVTKSLDALAHAARRRFAARVGKLSVACPPQTACTATVDEQPFETGRVVFFPTGAHAVVVRRGDARERFDVALEPGKTVQLVATLGGSAPPRPARTAEPGSPSPAASQGVSPTWFWLGVGVTAALGVASGISFADVLDKHQTFAADRSSTDVSSRGKDAQLRTNVLLAATGAAALVTGAVGLFGVEWADGRRASASVVGTSVVLGATF